MCVIVHNMPGVNCSPQAVDVTPVPSSHNHLYDVRIAGQPECHGSASIDTREQAVVRIVHATTRTAEARIAVDVALEGSCQD